MSERGKKSATLPAWVAQLQELLKSGSLATTLLNAAIAHAADQESRETRRFLMEAFWLLQRRRLPVGGARDFHGLKPVILRKNFQALRDFLTVDVTLVVSAVTLWFLHRPPLHDALRRIAEAQGLAFYEFGKSDLQRDQRWPVEWKPGQLESMVEELAAQGHIPLEEAKLALFVLCLKPAGQKDSNVPAAAEPPPEAPAPSSPPESPPVTEPRATPPLDVTASPAPMSEHFTRFLSLLDSLPDEAPEWEALDGFLAACTEKARQRHERYERRQGRRRRLEDVLARLASPEAQEALAFLSHLTGHEQWKASVPAEADLEHVVGRLEQLVARLEQLTAHQSLPPARTALEQRERNKQLDALVVECEQLHQELTGRLLQPAAPAAPATPPEAALPEKVEAAAPPAAEAREDRPAPQPAPAPPVSAAPLPAPVAEPVPSREPPPASPVAPPPEVTPEPPPASERKTSQAPPPPDVKAAAPPLARELPTSRVEPSPPVDRKAPVLPSRKRSRREAAEALLANDSAESRTSFLFSLITEGDVAGAYWLARAMDARSEGAPVPSWLLAALAGSMRLQGDSMALTSGLLTIASEHAWPQEPHLQLLAMASALPSVIRSPGSGLVGWLTTPDLLPALREVVEPVRDFSSYGVSLPADSQLLLRSHDERSERVRAAVAEIGRWHERVWALRTSYIPARNVLNFLLKGGELEELLHAAELDDRSRLEDVGRKLSVWRDSFHVNAAIEEVRRREKIKDRIVGSALGWIHSRVEELCERVASWHELAQLDEKLSHNYDWMMKQLGELRQKLSAAFPRALVSLDVHEREDSSAPVAAGCAALRRALSLVADMLNLRLEGLEFQVPRDVALRERLLDAEGGLESLLERRLMMLPEVRLPDDKQRWSEGLGTLFQSLPREVLSERGVEEAIESWLVHKDFRFIPRLLPLVEAPERARQIEERMRLEQEEARRELKRRIERIRAEVEQAVVDGFIGDERSELLGYLDSIVVDTAREVNGPHGTLNGIAGKLEAARQRGRELQRERWHQLQPRLTETSWTAEHRELAARRIDEVLGAGDYRSADELLARLEDSVENHREFDAALFAAPKREMHHLEDFIQALPRMDVELHNVRGRDVPKRVQEVLPAEAERRDLRHAHDAWFSLVNARAHLERVPELVHALLGHLGFALEGGPQEAFTRLKEEPHLLFQVKASSRGLSPVPHFGSRVQGRLRVMCVWVPQGREVLTGAFQQLRSESEGTLVLYLDRLGLTRRRQLFPLSRQHSASALVVDEWLLLYLTSLYEGPERLRALFDCTLPFTAINPYIQRGAVPPEMFFGREEMARRLASLEGTSLVYGGRQLGKSALLEQVERRFVEGDPGRHFAIRLDIKDLGDPATDNVPEHLWLHLRDELKRKRFLAVQVTTDKPDDLVRRIGEGLGGEKGRKLLILLDEADNFLDADAKRGFEQVKRLRDLMSRHPGLCKVVLAGLHNVQRFQGIANQPLAHFGSALLVGPLEARDATELVRQPLEALGFRFSPEEGNGSILRILSYTNYHPGLIQLFCRELVDMLQRRADPQQQPPYLLRETDVEEVYRKQETRQLIRERFDWTLALDPRYQAVVWRLIVEQAGGLDGFGRSFSTSSILSLVRDSWSQGFKNVESDEMQGLLDEMVGLGVLVRNAHGEYRLRSPNVVRLLGSIPDIWDRLGELAKKPEPVAFDADHHHVRLGRGDPPRYSPLTYAQERLVLAGSRSGVVLLLGNQATQVEDLPDALRRTLVSAERPNHGACELIPADLRTPQRLQEWLKEALQQQRSVERLLFLGELSAAEVREGQLLEAARDCLERQPGKKRWARVAFVLRPAAAWVWTTQAIPARPDREQVPLIPLRRWTWTALVRRLEEADIRTADESFLKRVLETTTGGWPYLVHRFVAECRRLHNERRAAESMERELRAGSPQATAFWKALELEALPRVVDILKLIHDMGGASPTDAFEGVLDGDVSALAGRSEQLLQLLVRLGCLEARGDKLCLERRVAEALPA